MYQSENETQSGDGAVHPNSVGRGGSTTLGLVAWITACPIDAFFVETSFPNQTFNTLKLAGKKLNP